MRIPLSVVACSVLVASMGPLLAQGQAALAPVYARVALPPNGQHVVLMKFRTSADRSVRNVLFADTNLDGKFQQSEKLVGVVKKIASRNYTSCRFPEFTVTTDGTAAGTTLIIQSLRLEQPDKTILEFYASSLRVSLSADQQRWTYHGSCHLAVGAGTDVKPSGAVGAPTLSVQTRPDEAKPGHTGFGVTLGWPTLQLYTFATPSGPGCVTLKVVDQQDRVLHQESVEISKLGFG